MSRCTLIFLPLANWAVERKCTKGGLMPDKPTEVTMSEMMITAHILSEPPAYVKKKGLGMVQVRHTCPMQDHLFAITWGKQ